MPASCYLCYLGFAILATLSYAPCGDRHRVWSSPSPSRKSTGYAPRGVRHILWDGNGSMVLVLALAMVVIALAVLVLVAIVEVLAVLSWLCDLGYAI